MAWKLRVAQISDLHVRRASDKRARHFDDWLNRCVARVNAASPDLVLVTGDLVDAGAEEEYRRLRALLAELQAPYYVMPGNHDEVHALRRIFADHAYLFENDSHLSYTVDAGALRILAVDSRKRGRPGGYLDEARLAWLESQLRAAPDTPTMLALHHPPFAAGVWPMDWLGFTNKRKLERIVRANPQIRRIVSGHVHCARYSHWGGTAACTSPSTRTQRLVVGAGWRPPVLHVEPGGFLLHGHDGNGTMDTQVHRLSGTVEPLVLP